MPTAGKKTFVNTAIMLWVTAIIIICGWIGCRKRGPGEPTKGMGEPSSHHVRVLLFDNIIRCTVKSETGFTARDADTGVEAKFAAGHEAATVSTISGRVGVGEHVFSKHVVIEPNKPYIFELEQPGQDNVKFRGNLAIRISEDGQGIGLVNEVPVEAYLCGVVGAEMPSYWEGEALKAQAVVSRTYCLFHKRKYGPRRAWDVRKTEANQVYKGLAAETRTVREAVDATKSEVLVFAEDDGDEDIFPAYFSSTCGGHTEAGDNVFRESSGALAGVKCEYCRGLARSSFFSWDKVEFTMKDVSYKLIEHYPSLERLKEIVDVKALEVSKYDDFERLKTVKLIGKNGQSQNLEAENFRLTLDPTGRQLKSTGCVITTSKGKLVFSKGRGFGHGVGLCQYGAQGQGRKGRKYDEILSFYYPGSKIRKVH